jgi:linoleoyl-CoA desaturase
LVNLNQQCESGVAHPRFDETADRPFSAAICNRAQAYLNASGDHRFGNSKTALKAIALFLCTTSLYCMSMLATRPATYVAYYVATCVAAVLLSSNTMHDASHGTLCRSRFLNSLVARIAAVPLGVEPVYWQVRHVRYHHPFANIEHYDLDTAANGFLRQTPFQSWAPQYRFQHLYWPAIAALSMSYIGWIFDWSDRLGLTPLKSDRLLPGVRGWTLFIVSKVLHFGVFLIGPMVALGPQIGYGTVVIAYVIGQMVASSILLLLLLGTHWADTEFFEISDGRPLPHSRDRHAFLTCCDWVARPRILNALLGGLNRHLTHHLFPTYGHRHYEVLSRIVEEEAQQHGLPYRCLTYSQLWKAQQSFLRSLGQPPVA